MDRLVSRIESEQTRSLTNSAFAISKIPMTSMHMPRTGDASWTFSERPPQASWNAETISSESAIYVIKHGNRCGAGATGHCGNRKLARSVGMVTDATAF